MQSIFLTGIPEFQSTPPRGGDISTSFIICSHTKISIHAPSRGRHRSRKYIRNKDDFNPRPLAGATYSNMWHLSHGEISIHAPSRGRPILGVIKMADERFQSTPPRGGDSVRRTASQLRTYFNPRPLAGATL